MWIHKQMEQTKANFPGWKVQREQRPISYPSAFLSSAMAAPGGFSEPLMLSWSTYCHLSLINWWIFDLWFCTGIWGFFLIDDQNYRGYPFLEAMSPYFISSKNCWRLWLLLLNTFCNSSFYPYLISPGLMLIFFIIQREKWESKKPILGYYSKMISSQSKSMSWSTHARRS